MGRWLWILISWGIVAFGQPAWFPWITPFAATIGYAIFWGATASYSKKKRLIVSGLWYTCVHLVQLSWMTSIEFQGIYILFVYGALCLWMGGQFALLTAFLADLRQLTYSRILAAAALWTLLEWSRLSFLCGFTWNPAGLALSGYLLPLQFAAVWGVYGLSFWVILTNLMAVKAFFIESKRRVRSGALWGSFAAIPVLFGIVHLNSFRDQTAEPYSVALVQTGLLPSQKIPLPGRYHEFISPFEQWKGILNHLCQEEQREWDLVVLPEAVVPFSMAEPVYAYPLVCESLEQICGKIALECFPPLEAPYAKLRLVEGKNIWCVSNAFWAQWIANYFQAEVVAGLDYRDIQEGKNYNAAFHFTPFQQGIYRYDKQVLLPLAEYLPFAGLRRWTQAYGINDFFTRGAESRVIQGKIPLSLSICYEETFPEVIRKGRIKGARMLVNVTNDNYYPHSRLPEQHFDHARLRAVENGVGLLRACNTGMTIAVDRFGRICAQLGNRDKASETKRGVLSVSVQVHSHPTLYLYWGDAGILTLCAVLLIFFFCFSKHWRKILLPIFGQEQG